MGERAAVPLTRALAHASALLILALGLLALGSPAGFVALVAALQPPPWLYVAAALRVAIGASFLLAARGSRGTIPLLFLGVVLIAGGLVIPLIGQGLVRPILDAWTAGTTGIVRGWGIAATVLSAFALWALRLRPVLDTEHRLGTDPFTLEKRPDDPA